MRTASWAASLLLLALTACNRAPRINLAGAATIAATSVDQGRTQLVLQAGPERLTVALPRDETVAPNQPPARVTVIGRTFDAIAITDTYPSAPGGLSYCQAGEEVFLRVLTIGEGHAESRYDAKLASCRGHLELADPGLEWSALTNTLQIHWLTGPHGGTETRRLTIFSKGRVDATDSQ